MQEWSYEISHLPKSTLTLQYVGELTWAPGTKEAENYDAHAVCEVIEKEIENLHAQMRKLDLSIYRLRTWQTQMQKNLSEEEELR